MMKWLVKQRVNGIKFTRSSTWHIPVPIIWGLGHPRMVIQLVDIQAFLGKPSSIYNRLQ